MKKDISRDQDNTSIDIQVDAQRKEEKKRYAKLLWIRECVETVGLSVANVNEDSVCCVVAALLNFALFNLIVVINEQSLKVFSTPQR